MNNQQLKIMIIDVKNVLVALLLLASFHLVAEEITFQYVYGNTGQLIRSIDSTGVVIQYNYDDVGNRLSTMRYTVDGLAVFGFSPSSGPVGQKVMLQGQNFSSTPVENKVTFNGVEATVLSADSMTMIISVPVGAITGKIVVSRGAESFTSVDDFIVIPAPTVVSIEPIALKSKSEQNVTVETFVVRGVNLTDSEFRFEPIFEPLAISVISAVVNSDGTEATLRLEINSGVSGSYSVIAKNDIGESEIIPEPKNTVLVFDENADSDGDLVSDYDEQFLCIDYLNPDSDGDSFTDRDEQESGSDPCSAASTPWTLPDAVLPEDILKETVGSRLTIINYSAPEISFGDSGVNVAASGAIFSLINLAPPPIDQTINNASGAMLSIMNQAFPTLEEGEVVNIGQAIGPMISVINESLPPMESDPAVFGGETLSPVISILNQADPPIDNGSNGGIGEATGPAFFIQSN